MKRILLTLSILALVGTAGVGMAENPTTTIAVTKTVEVSKPAGMEKIHRPVLVTIEAPEQMLKEHHYVTVAGREVELTNRKFSIELSPEQLKRLHEKREVGFGAKGFLKTCQKVTITRSDKPSEKAANVFIKLGVKSEKGMEKPVCEYADVTVFTKSMM